MKKLLSLCVLISGLSLSADHHVLNLDELMETFGWDFESAEIRTEKVADGLYLLFGGVGLNFDGVERTEMYIASVKRLQAREEIEVNITNHAVMGKIFERAEKLKARNPGYPHPFVDPDGFQAFLDFRLSEGEQKLAEEKRKIGQ